MAITRKKRTMPQLNGAALADISFLFLIFFLLVATMDFDQGIPRQLPRIVECDFIMEIQDRNLMVISVNHLDQVQARNQLHPDVRYEHTDELIGTATQPALADLVREFILNERDLPILPQLQDSVFGPGIGQQRTTAGWHVISLQNDMTTSYRAFMAVQNEIVRAVNQLREEASQRFFNMSFDALGPDERSQIIAFMPLRLSQAEPRSFGGGS